MEKRLLLLVLLLGAVVVSAGCVGDGGDSVSPEEVRDGFVGNGSDVPSYAYESETTFEFSPVSGTDTRINTTKTEGVLDYENRELRAEIVSSGGTPGDIKTIRETTSYIVNGTGYDRTVPGSGGWIEYDDPSEINRTWGARDELGFYAGVLRNASVSTANEESIDGTEAGVLNVKLNDDERVDFLRGNLGDDPGFLGDMRMDEFETTVWISEDGNRLVRAETEATAVAPDVPVGNQRMDIRVEMSFVDEFSYDEPVNVELPDEARTDSG